MKTHEAWEQEDFKILQENELKGEERRGKLCSSIDTPGVQVSIRIYAFASNSSKYLRPRFLLGGLAGAAAGFESARERDSSLGTRAGNI